MPSSRCPTRQCRRPAPSMTARTEDAAQELIPGATDTARRRRLPWSRGCLAGRRLIEVDLFWIVIAVVSVLLVTVAAMSARVVQQYEKGLVFRLGRLRDGVRGP